MSTKKGTRFLTAAVFFLTAVLGLGSASSSAQLPAGWEVARDPASGRVYYFNRNSKESAWRPPLPPQSEKQSTSMTSPLPPQEAPKAGESRSTLPKRSEPTDKNIHCEDWAGKGECVRNPMFMLQTCPKSCSLVAPPPPLAPATPTRSTPPLQSVETAVTDLPRTPQTIEVAIPFAVFVLLVLLTQGYLRSKRDLAWAGGKKGKAGSEVSRTASKAKQAVHIQDDMEVEFDKEETLKDAACEAKNRTTSPQNAMSDSCIYDRALMVQAKRRIARLSAYKTWSSSVLSKDVKVVSEPLPMWRAVLDTELDLAEGSHTTISSSTSRAGAQSGKGACQPTPSSHVCRSPLASPTGQKDEIRRGAMSCLNKICPENVSVILEKLVALVRTSSTNLETVVSVLFQKALCDPHYCETFADVVFELSSRFPELTPTDSSEEPTSFRIILEVACLQELQKLDVGRQCEEASEDESERRRKKDPAYMKFIGNLFLRQLLSSKLIVHVLQELLSPNAASAACVECACTLLQSVGHTLDATDRGKVHVNHVCARLMDLKGSGGPPHKPWESKLPQFKIQDLLDLRANNWRMKLFTERAQTLETIRNSNKGPGFQEVVAGSMPGCMAT